MAEYKIGLLTIYGTIKHKEKMTCKNSVQYRYSLMINGIFNGTSVSTRIKKFYCISTEICQAFRKYLVDKDF